MTTIEDVIRIAVNAHDGQKDMVGNPAFLHEHTTFLEDLTKAVRILEEMLNSL